MFQGHTITPFHDPPRLWLALCFGVVCRTNVMFRGVAHALGATAQCTGVSFDKAHKHCHLLRLGWYKER